MISFSLSFVALCAQAQQLVVDPALATTLVVTHTEQQSTLNDIKSSESAIRNYQILIQAKLMQIKDMQDKVYSYLSTAQSVVKNVKDIIYASQIARQIAEYQSKMFELAAGDPKLLIVAAKTEYELISRSADLFLYIYNFATAGGANNLLDNKQRIDLVIHVVEELKMMRGLAFAVNRQMRQAAREGIWKTMSPGSFRYVTNGQRTIDRLLRDINYIGNGGRY